MFLCAAFIAQAAQLISIALADQLQQSGQQQSNAALSVSIGLSSAVVKLVHLSLFTSACSSLITGMLSTRQGKETGDCNKEAISIR